MLNLVAQFTSIFVGDVSPINVSKRFVSADFQRSEVDEGSGLVLCSGKIQLAGYVAGEAPLEMDDRLSTLWQKGTKVITRYNTELVHLGGTMFIESAEYAPDELMLTLNVACKLSMQNARSRADIGVCITLGTSKSVGVCAEELLTLAGVSGPYIGFDNVPGALREPIYVDEGQSLIGLAAELLKDNGYFMWQRNDGAIVAQSFLEPSNDFAVALHDADLQIYARDTARQLPPDEYAINGEYRKSVQFVTIKPDIQIIETATSRTERDTTINYDSRRIVVQEDTQEMLKAAAPAAYPGNDNYVPISTSTEESIYEQKTAALDPQTCLPRDEGRLISKTRKVQMANGKALEGYWSARAEFLQLPILQTGFNLGFIDAIEETETWRYRLPRTRLLEGIFTVNDDGSLIEPGSISSQFNTVGNYFVEIIKERKELGGAMMPILGKDDLGRGTAPDETYANLVLPFELKTTYYEYIRYTLNADRQSWSLNRYVMQPRYRVEPEQIQAMIDATNEDGDYLHGLGEVVEAAFEMKRSDGETSNKTSQQDPPRFPSDEQPFSTPFRYKVQIANGSKDPFKRSSGWGGGQYAYSPNTTVQCASAALARDWAKYKGSQLATAASIVPTDIAPLDRFVVSDRRANKTFVFASDLHTISINQTQAIFGCKGLLIGYSPYNAEPVDIAEPETPLVYQDAIASFDYSYFSDASASIVAETNSLATSFANIPNMQLAGEEWGYQAFADIVLQDDSYILVQV